MPETPTEVSAEAAFAAASERVLKTTHALMMAEAQIVELRARVGKLERDCISYAAELTTYRERDQDATEEVKHDATAAEEPEFCPRGAARSAHDFSD